MFSPLNFNPGLKLPYHHYDCIAVSGKIHDHCEGTFSGIYMRTLGGRHQLQVVNYGFSNLGML